jgi:hypothetical protein
VNKGHCYHYAEITVWYVIHRYTCRYIKVGRLSILLQQRSSVGIVTSTGSEVRSRVLPGINVLWHCYCKVWNLCSMYVCMYIHMYVASVVCSAYCLHLSMHCILFEFEGIRIL